MPPVQLSASTSRSWLLANEATNAAVFVEKHIEPQSRSEQNTPSYPMRESELNLQSFSHLVPHLPNSRCVQTSNGRRDMLTSLHEFHQRHESLWWMLLGVLALILVLAFATATASF